MEFHLEPLNSWFMFELEWRVTQSKWRALIVGEGSTLVHGAKVSKEMFESLILINGWDLKLKRSWSKWTFSLVERVHCTLKWFEWRLNESFSLIKDGKFNDFLFDDVILSHWWRDNIFKWLFFAYVSSFDELVLSNHLICWLWRVVIWFVDFDDELIVSVFLHLLLNSGSLTSKDLSVIAMYILLLTTCKRISRSDWSLIDLNNYDTHFINVDSRWV